MDSSRSKKARLEFSSFVVGDIDTQVFSHLSQKVRVAIFPKAQLSVEGTLSTYPRFVEVGSPERHLAKDGEVGALPFALVWQPLTFSRWQRLTRTVLSSGDEEQQEQFRTKLQQRAKETSFNMIGGCSLGFFTSDEIEQLFDFCLDVLPDALRIEHCGFPF